MTVGMDEVELVGYLTAKKHLSERIIDPEGCCFTLMAMTHGYGQGFIIEYEDEKDELLRSEQDEG